MSKTLTPTEAIAKYCPDAQTVEDLCKNNEAQIVSLCRSLECDRTELLLSSKDVLNLLKKAPLSKKDKSKFKKNFTQLISDNNLSL